MTTVNIHEAKTYLSRFVDQAAAGEEIIIARAGKPVARLVPLEAAPQQRKLGWFKGRLNVSEEFDAPLPEEALAGFADSPIEPAKTRAKNC